MVCYNSVVAMGAWLGLMRAGWKSGDEAVDYYDKRVALAAFAEVPETDLDDAPMSWAITPAREMGQSVAERMLQRIVDGKSSTRNQIMPPRLVKQV